MRMLITSGGTKVPIDTVRDISNMSHGTFGSRIAHAALEAGHEVDFLCAKYSRTPFSQMFDFHKGPDDITFDAFEDWDVSLAELARLFNFCEEHRDRYHETRFRNFDDYALHLEGMLKKQEHDAVILAAAVSDYGVANYVDGKIRSSDGQTIELEPLQKLIHFIKQWQPGCVLTGFKLLVGSTSDELTQAATASIESNNCDLVVANDLHDIKNDDHKLLVVDEKGITPYHKSDQPDDPLYLAQQVVTRTEEAWNARYSSESPVV